MRPLQVIVIWSVVRVVWGGTERVRARSQMESLESEICDLGPGTWADASIPSTNASPNPNSLSPLRITYHHHQPQIERSRRVGQGGAWSARFRSGSETWMTDLTMLLLLLLLIWRVGT